MKTPRCAAEHVRIVNGRGTYGALAQRLREFEPRQGRQRRWAGKSRNILHILSYNAAKHLGDTGLKMMQERGRIQKGMVADIVVFDPERFTDNSTYDKGSSPSTGMKAVIVNGQITVSDDKVLPVFAGQPIRFEPEAKPRFQPISLEGWNNEFSTGMPDTFTGAFPKDGKK